MDRGEMHTNLRLTACDVQVCRYDLGDFGAPTLFLTASATEGPSGPVADSPVDLDAPNRTWPEVTNIDELDDLIAALQQHRAWIAEYDPDKREQL